MKTIYLIGWIANAIIIFYVTDVDVRKHFMVLLIFNLLIPVVILAIRLAMLHLDNNDENGLPL